VRKMPSNKNTAANRRPAEQSNGSGKFRRDYRSRQAFPAAVAEFDRSPEEFMHQS